MIIVVTWDNLLTTLINKVVTVSITVRFTFNEDYVVSGSHYKNFHVNVSFAEL